MKRDAKEVCRYGAPTHVRCVDLRDIVDIRTVSPPGPMFFSSFRLVPAIVYQAKNNQDSNHEPVSNDPIRRSVIPGQSYYYYYYRCCCYRRRSYFRKNLFCSCLHRYPNKVFCFVPLRYFVLRVTRLDPIWTVRMPVINMPHHRIYPDVVTTDARMPDLRDSIPYKNFVRETDPFGTGHRPIS